MHRCYGIISLLVASVLSWAGQAVAGFEIKHDPSAANDLFWGCAVTYRIEGADSVPGAQITGYNWTFEKCPGSWTPVTATPTNPTETAYEIYPGTFRVKCTLTLQHVQGGPPPPQTLDVFDQIAIPPPEKAYVVSGSGVSTQFGSDQEIIFGIKSNGHIVHHGVGFAQEILVLRRDSFGRPTPLDPQAKQWTPKSGPGTRFHLTNFDSQIRDLKGWGGPLAAWNQRLPGLQESVVQRLRIAIPKCGGGYDYHLLSPPFNVASYKNQDGTYQDNVTETE